jgi:methylthioribulose-1-phosphate dehydratase
VAYLVHRDLEMLKGLAGITTHDCVVSVPVLSNDQDLRRLSERASPHLKEAPQGILIAGHGLYAWGRDLLEQQWRWLLLQACQLPQAFEAARRKQP